MWVPTQLSDIQQREQTLHRLITATFPSLNISDLQSLLEFARSLAAAHHVKPNREK